MYSPIFSQHIRTNIRRRIPSTLDPFARRVLTAISVATAAIPLIILLLALQADTAYKRLQQDIIAGASLRYECLEIYGASQPVSKNAHWRATLSRMSATLDYLGKRYPDAVARTAPSWTAFSSSLNRTGGVDWPTTTRMEHASTFLRDDLHARGEALGQDSVELLIIGIGGFLASIAGSFFLVRRLDSTRDGHNRMAQALDSSTDFVAIITKSGSVVYANQALRRLLGVSEWDHIEQETIARLYPPGARESFFDSILPSAAKEGGWEGESTFLTSEGRPIPVSQIITANYDERGAVRYLYSIARDISERKKIEDELRYSHERLQQAQSLVRVGSWERDMSSGAETWSDEMYRIFGIDPAQGPLTFHRLVGLFIADDRARVREAEKKLVSTGEPFDLEHRAITPDGELRFIHACGSCVRAGDGSIRYIIGTVVDVTERKLAEQEKQRLAAIVESSGDAIVGLTLEGVFVSWNRAAEEMLGCTAAEMLGRHASTLDSSLDRQTFGAISRRLLDVEKSVQMELRRDRKDGSAIWLSLSFSPILNTEGTVIGIGLVARDVTERARLTEELRESKLFAERIAENSTSIIYVFDLDNGRPVFENRNAAEVHGYDPGMVRSMGDRFLASIMHPDDLEAMQSRNEKIKELKDGEVIEHETRIRHADGEWRWLWNREVVFKRREDGTPYQVMGTAQDITARKQVEEQIKSYSTALEHQKRELEQANLILEAIATEDGLTGLKNHRAFQERLSEEFMRAQRFNTPLSLIMLDVDSFKDYNDEFGHPAGDDVLRELGAIMRDTARTTDIAARYGGEEFVMLLPHTDSEGAAAIAERLRQGVETADWKLRPVTISLGIAWLEAATHRPQELVATADAAMYDSKRNGRNQVSIARTAQRRPTKRAAAAKKV